MLLKYLFQAGYTGDGHLRDNETICFNNSSHANKQNDILYDKIYCFAFFSTR